MGRAAEIRRVTSEEKATDVQAQQLPSLLTTEAFPFHEGFSVCVVDSTLSAITFLGQVQSLKHRVTIARTRSNRVFYDRPVRTHGERGHPRWYGQRFDLKDPTTWRQPDLVDSIHTTTRRGRRLTVQLSAWQHVSMRGTHKYPMHEAPFTLMRIDVVDRDGKPAIQHPLWLTAIGERRDPLSLLDLWEAYRQRYDVEHFFRFGKQNLSAFGLYRFQFQMRLFRC